MSLSPIKTKKTNLDLGRLMKTEKTNTTAREAGSVFSVLKLGSLCHVVGTKASLREFKDHTYYYTFLETK